MLVGVIVVIALLISCAVIIVHSSFSRNDEEYPSELSGSQHYSDEYLAADIPAQTDQSPKENNFTAEQSDNNDNLTVSRQVTAQPFNNITQPSAAPSVNTNSSLTTPANRLPNATTTAAPSAQRPVQEFGTLVFVIDDAGNNLRELEPFLRVPYPLTIAVLPGLPYSAEAARRVRAAGKEVILHQPMEALGAQNPGPGGIYSYMSAGEITEVLSRNIAEVGPIAGINNHQGSKITMDSEAMKVILNFCSEQGIYFLDSRTTSDTAAPFLAQQMGIKIAERNIFIDNEQNKNAMLGYIASGLARAQRYGTAVMIGHAWSPDLAPLLLEQLPLYIEQGYTVKTVSDILR